jgi:Flp pilus assembly pilin Flp
MKGLKRFHGDQRGIESLEYLLIAALVIIASAGAWKHLGQRVADNVNKVADVVDKATADSLQRSGFGGSGGAGGQ